MDKLISPPQQVVPSEKDSPVATHVEIDELYATAGGQLGDDIPDDELAHIEADAAVDTDSDVDDSVRLYLRDIGRIDRLKSIVDEKSSRISTSWASVLRGFWPRAKPTAHPRCTRCTR